MGKVIAVPDNIKELHSLEKVQSFPRDSLAYESAVCWFENQFTTMEEWTEEAYINHSFEPNCLWHMSFIIARYELPAGTELTVNYEHLLGEGITSEFEDHSTGKKFAGIPWKQIIRWNAAELLRIYQ